MDYSAAADHLDALYEDYSHLNDGFDGEYPCLLGECQFCHIQYPKEELLCDCCTDCIEHLHADLLGLPRTPRVVEDEAEY